VRLLRSGRSRESMKCGCAHDARPDSGIRARMTQTSHAANSGGAHPKEAFSLFGKDGDGTDLATGGRPDSCRLDWLLG
jgi:hypothetical protein